MDRVDTPPLPVRLTRRLEQATALDRAVRAVEPKVTAVFGTGARGAVLRGDWLGHALHPTVADLALGSWTSATLLDVVGRGRWAGAARTLVAAGLLAAAPAAWTGWAEWSAATPREKRVGLVHAIGNGVAIGL